MQVNPAPFQAPDRPVVPPGARSIDVPYTAPVTRDEVIGQMPSYTFHITPVDLGGDDVDVVRPQPVLDASGAPTWQPAVARLDLTPYSPWKKGAIGAGIGAAVGGVAGAVAGYFAGNIPLFAGLGAAGGAAIGGVIKVADVWGDTVKPEWEPRQVVKYRFDGYSHTFVPQTMTINNGKTTTVITTGYHHYYSEKVSEHQVGNHWYWAPVARHSADA